MPPGNPPKTSEKVASTDSRSRVLLSTRFFEKFKFSEEVARILELARVLGTSKNKLVTTACLLFGFAETGHADSELRRTPQFLWEELSKSRKLYDEAFKEEFPRATTDLSRVSIPDEQTITQNVAKVLEFALEISSQTYKPKPQPLDDAQVFSSDVGRISARHLLAALLMLNRPAPAGSLHILSKIIDPEVFRRRFLDFIVESLPDDNHDEWQKILQVTPKTTRRASESPVQTQHEPAVEGHLEGIPTSVLSQAHDQAVELEAPLADVIGSIKSVDQAETSRTAETVETDLDLRPVLAGFATDYWRGKDLLNIEDDVNALASLVSAWSVEPPLAIGLFGDWGSGKSHFMRQMRQQVDKLSRKARKSGKKQNEIGYYKNIVQIEFNAWHYIEGNLWASLVNHIFANLSVREGEDVDIVEARRDELMTKLEIKKEIDSKLKSKIEQKQTQLKIKQKQAADLEQNAEKKKDDLSTQLAGFRSEAEKQLNELEVPLKVSEEDKKLLKRLGVNPDNWRTAADFRKHYDELKGFSNRIAAQWNLFRTDRKVRRRVFMAAGITAIPILALLLPTVSQQIKLPAGVLAVVGIVATFLTAARPVWKQFRDVLNALEEHDAVVERERQKRIDELQAEVTALAKTVLDAQTQAASIKTEIETLEEQIKSTTTTQILAEFIDDRAAASDYRRHLGLVALIRRDFEKLRDLFTKQRKEEEKGKETHHKNRINRIILYIDDLDRCKPERVVEVLQAIHLLLAFPIFVVVVGVDARWVTRSLQESYEWFRQEDDEARKREDHEPDEQHDLEGATPHDYLEKIFQIPFWLRPMEEEQCKSFIEGLTAQVRYRPPAEGAEETNGDRKSEVNVDLKSAPELENSGGNGQPPAGETVTENAQRIEPEVESAKGENVEATPADDSVENTASTTTDADADDDDESDEADDGDDEAIDLSPQSLTLGDKEIEYMTSLAKLIGRSPRAVKRFLNCYRLIKVSLPPEKLKEFVKDGESYEYRAVMILLGIITGSPGVSLYVIEEIENWKWQNKEQPTMKNFLEQLERNVDLPRTSEWQRVSAVLTGFGGTEESVAIFAALRAVTPRVSRFSFRVGRAEATGPKRTPNAPTALSRKPQRAGKDVRASTS